jgi:two-component system phosphate regulon sensor histidine kinase PhoR
MTHEFKTPLSSILLASHFLHKQDSIQKDEKLEHYTDIIIKQSNKLNSHIEQILNIAKSDNSSMKMNIKGVALLPILEEVAENMKLKHPNLAVKINTQKDYSILADEFHFTNIIYNLIDNSIKYCNEDPEICITIEEIPKYLKLQFSDNGIGIPSKNTPFIFDKFYRVPSAMNNEVNGFGLGLYYVKKICTLHHWKISVDNNTNKGISIVILIPN